MKITLFKNKTAKNWKKDKLKLDPNFYWKMAICGALFLALLSFAFGYYLFTQINQEPLMLSGVSGKKAEEIDKDRIKNILQYFSEREKKSNQIINSPSPIVDPSR